MKVSAKSKPVILINISCNFNKFFKFYAKTVLKLNLKIPKMVSLTLN